MTRVEKLSIRGIRSFGDDDNDEQCIKFLTPLTLILGQNGCGKTTIIESLKYVTSGEFPHGGGRSFVRDPKIANLREVFGQVKLMFMDTKGKPVTVVRSMKCTQTAKNLSFAAVDQTVSRKDDHGGVASVSLRCADVDAEISRCLGVSKAVILNVLFCPQGESYWPLDEGKKVKEKFDAIFDATKYNKCIEHIIKFLKEKTTSLKILQTEVHHLGNNKTEAEEKKRNLTNHEQRLSLSRDEIKEIQNRLGPISDRLQHIQSIENKVVRMQTNLVSKSTKLEAIKKQVRDLRSNLNAPFPGSTEELKQSIHSFKSELKDKERCLINLQEEAEDIKRKEKRARDDLGIEQVKLGQLQEEEKQHKRLSNERISKLQSLAKDLSIPSASLSVDEELSHYDVKRLLDNVERKLEEIENDFEKTRSRCKAEEMRHQSQVNESRDQKVKIEQEIHMKEKQLLEAKNDVTKLKAELQEVQLSAGRLTKLEEDLKDVDHRLRREESAFNLEAEKQELISLKDKRNRLQDRLEEVNKEVHSLQRLSGIQAELDVHTQTQCSKESEVKRLQRKHNDTLIHLLQKVPERGFKFALETRMDQLADVISKMNSQIRDKEKELTELETNRKHLKDQLRKREDLLRENEEDLYDLCGGVDYEEKLASVRRQVDELQDVKGTLTSSEYLFKRYIKKLQEVKPCCPLCHRDFPSDSEAQNLVSDLNKNVRELPFKMKENKSKLDNFEATYSKLLQKRSVYENISEMKEKEIPDLRTKVSAIESQIKDVHGEIKGLQSDLSVPMMDEEMAKSAINDMVLLDQVIGELQNVNKEIERIRASMPSSESSRTMKAAQAEQQSIQSEFTDAMKESEGKQAALNSHSDKISNLRGEHNNIMSEKLKIQGGLQSCNALRERLKEKDELQNTIDVEISLKRSELFDANEEMKRLQTEKEKAISRLHKEVEESREKVDQVKRSVKEIQTLSKTIEKMELDGVERNVAASRTRLSRLENSAEAAFSEQQVILQRIDGIRMELSTQQVKERELADNLKLRELELEEDALDTEVSTLKIEMGDVKFDTIREEKRKLCKEEEEITRKKSLVEGRKMELESSIQQLERELMKNIYKNAEKDYRDKFFEWVVTKKACDDMKQFCTALDWAIMHFHKERMQSINRIIRELWTSVYRGNDVDYIEIRTDETGEGTTVSDKKRSYNYRVVMVKRGVEVDMRDRCSAGQRMLACLLIRLALAETFSSQCGIFALDEPTANLDFDNSISLSEALAEIVSRRYSQKNFQLIVITHDEKFVENLAKEGNVRKYYAVSRNADGKSVISTYELDG